jgi:hypothetical protein
MRHLRCLADWDRKLKNSFGTGRVACELQRITIAESFLLDALPEQVLANIPLQADFRWQSGLDIGAMVKSAYGV